MVPLAQEGYILNESNSIRIADSSSKAIEAVLPSLQESKWDRKTVWNGFADAGIWSPYGAGSNRKEVPVCQDVDLSLIHI